MSKIKLCVNVDHIATVREARGEIYPDPVKGAQICEESGAHGITVHLREDRRHIQDSDVIALRDVVVGKYNLEMALSDDVISVAKRVVPNQITLVPEKREELTTEGGLNVKKHFDKIKQVVSDFKNLGVLVSLFIEPEKEIIEISQKTGAEFIEIHTGAYCNAKEDSLIKKELQKILDAGVFAKELGLGVNAGHGLNIYNLKPVLDLEGLEELNIGHSIISRAIYLGLEGAVQEMLAIINSKN